MCVCTRGRRTRFKYRASTSDVIVDGASTGDESRAALKHPGYMRIKCTCGKGRDTKSIAAESRLDWRRARVHEVHIFYSIR